MSKETRDIIKSDVNLTVFLEFFIFDNFLKFLRKSNNSIAPNTNLYQYLLWYFLFFNLKFQKYAINFFMIISLISISYITLKFFEIVESSLYRKIKLVSLNNLLYSNLYHLVASNCHRPTPWDNIALEVLGIGGS